MLDGKTLGTQIIAQFSAKGIVGSMMPPFSMSLGEGIVESFKAMNLVTTSDTGFISSGTGKGKLLGLDANLLFNLIAPLMSSNNIRGTQMVPMSQAICSALVQHFLSMNVVDTISLGVATGAGVGKVSNLIPLTMNSAIVAKMKSRNIAGTSLVPLVQAVSQGFCNHVMSSGKVNVAIAGTPSPTASGSPIPGAGVGKGKVS